VEKYEQTPKFYAVFVDGQRYSRFGKCPVQGLQSGDRVTLSFKTNDKGYNDILAISKLEQASVSDYPEPQAQEDMSISSTRHLALERAIEFVGVFVVKEAFDKLNFDERKQLVMQVAREFDEFLQEPIV
jgi:hypothetical protein